MNMWRKWWNGDEAATAIEFAIVGVPFVFIMIGLIEVSLMFAANSMLQDATSQAARVIRTGQVQQAAGDPEEVFRDQLCYIANIFLDCDKVQYEVVQVNNFDEAESNQPSFDSDGNLVSQGFDPGGVSDVVLVRTVYYYPLMTPFIGPLLADGPNQTKFMMTTMVLETEPYQFEAGGG
jgi:Flp pilus assembly protein TadG